MLLSVACNGKFLVQIERFIRAFCFIRCIGVHRIVSNDIGHGGAANKNLHAKQRDNGGCLCSTPGSASTSVGAKVMWVEVLLSCDG